MAFRVVLILMLLIQVKRLSNTFFPIRRNQSVGSVIDFNWLRLISVNASYFVDRHKPLQIFYILRAFHSARLSPTQLNSMEWIYWYGICVFAHRSTHCVDDLWIAPFVRRTALIYVMHFQHVKSHRAQNVLMGRNLYWKSPIIKSKQKHKHNHKNKHNEMENQ